MAKRPGSKGRRRRPPSAELLKWLKAMRTQRQVLPGPGQQTPPTTAVQGTPRAMGLSAEQALINFEGGARHEISEKRAHKERADRWRGMFPENVRLNSSMVQDRRGVAEPDWVEMLAPAWRNVRGGARHEISEKLALERLRTRKEKKGRRMTKAPQIRGAAPIPAGAVGAAVSVGRAVVNRMKGSPITGPTKVARMSSAAAGPVAGSLKRPKTKPAPRRRSGSAARLY